MSDNHPLPTARNRIDQYGREQETVQVFADDELMGEYEPYQAGLALEYAKTLVHDEPGPAIRVYQDCELAYTYQAEPAVTTTTTGEKG